MKMYIFSYSLRSKQTMCTLGKLIRTYRAVPDDCESNFLATARDSMCGWPNGKPGHFFGMLAKRLASMSKKRFLALFARARLGKHVFFLRGHCQGLWTEKLNWRKCAFSLQQHNLPKFIDVRVLLLGFKMLEHYRMKIFSDTHLNIFSYSDLIWPDLGMC